MIKGADPTARVAVGGVTEPTPLRLEWLEQVLASYNTQFGVDMRSHIDAWTIHIQITPERRGSWGAEIPVGLPDVVGETFGMTIGHYTANADVNILKQLIYDFCEWLVDQGERDKELIISEYGVLFPSNMLDPQNPANGDQMVIDFMTGSFDFFLSAKDSELGLATDEGRLVQRWLWFSLNEKPYHVDPAVGFNGSLFEWDDPTQPTIFGVAYRDYVFTPSVSPTNTPINTPTETPTNTPIYTPTITPTPTNTYTPTLTLTPSIIPTPTNTSTYTPTYTPTITLTPTNTYTPTSTLTPSITPTPTNTLAITLTPTSTYTPTPTLAPSITPTPTETAERYWFNGHVYDDDTGEDIPGVSVKLYRWIGTDWSEISSTSTGSTGYFWLEALAQAGKYAVVEIDLDGYSSTRASVAPGFNGEVVNPDRIEFDNPPLGIVGPSIFYDVLSVTPTATPTKVPVQPTATPTVVTSSALITPGEGGTLTSPDGSVQVTAPPGAVSEDTNLTYTWLPAQLGTCFYPAGYAFRLDAETIGGDPLAGCSMLVLVVIRYQSADVPPGMLEEDLKLYSFEENSGEWQELSSVTNTEASMLVARADCTGLFSAGWAYSAHLPLIFKNM